jgi:hypothetical protein
VVLKRLGTTGLNTGIARLNTVRDNDFISAFLCCRLKVENIRSGDSISKLVLPPLD